MAQQKRGGRLEVGLNQKCVRSHVIYKVIQSEQADKQWLSCLPCLSKEGWIRTGKKKQIYSAGRKTCSTDVVDV